jgi:hypothetical protein
MKLFRDVKKGEKVYILEHMTFKVHPCEVKVCGVHPKSRNKKVYVLEIYLPFKNKAITDEALKVAETLGTKTATQLFVNGEQSMQVIAIAPMPTMLATTEAEIVAWLGTATPHDVNLNQRLRYTIRYQDEHEPTED